MSIQINDDFMCLEINGKILATARRRDDDWWRVSYWPRFLDRNQAITALTVTALLKRGPRQQRSGGEGAPRGVAITDRLMQMTTALTLRPTPELTCVVSGLADLASGCALSVQGDQA